MPKLKWLPIEAHPKNPFPFWMGTRSGGVMMESWHWCSERNDFAGMFSGTTLTEAKAQAPNERFLWAEMQAPKMMAS